MLRVDVIIPCHNAAPFIADAIDSALRQTYRAVRVVVIDDGSTDESVRVARRFGDRVTIAEQANEGPAVARNRGIELTDGDCLAFLDADDRWDRGKIERQVAALRERPGCGLVHTAIRLIDADGRVIGRPLNAARRHLSQGHCQLRLIAENTITTSSVLLRREVLGDSRFDPALVGPEDWDMWLRLSARTSFGYLEQELTDYRVHDANLVLRRERMLSMELLVLDRLEAASMERGARHAVHRRRQRVWASLGHGAYARGEAAAARRCFFRAGTGIDRDGLIEYAAVLLPPLVRQPLRRWWKQLRTTPQAQ